MRRRSSPLRAATLVAIAAAGLLPLSACASGAGQPPPSGAHDPEVVAARAAAVAEEQDLLVAAALGEPITTSVQDTCKRGTYSAPWGPYDPYYWSCGHVTSRVVSTATVDPAQLIADYRAHLAEVGCTPDEAAFDMTAEYWQMYGVPGHNANGEAYTVDDLPGGTAVCADGRTVGVAFRSAAGFDTKTFFTYVEGDGETITDEPPDLAAIRDRAPELVVVLSTSTGYHSVLRKEPEPPSTPEPGYCACYSGSACDCPGG